MGNTSDLSKTYTNQHDIAFSQELLQIKGLVELDIHFLHRFFELVHGSHRDAPVRQEWPQIVEAESARPSESPVPLGVSVKYRLHHHRVVGIIEDIGSVLPDGFEAAAAVAFAGGCDVAMDPAPPLKGSDDDMANLKPCQGGHINQTRFQQNHADYATQVGDQMAPIGNMLKRLIGWKHRTDVA